MIKAAITVDWREFRKGFSNLTKGYGAAVANAFGELSREARDELRVQTRKRFKLHSDYIPNSILNTPATPQQLNAAARSVERYHDITSSVFLRGASSPKKSLDFMTLHEDGGVKSSADGSGSIAVPAQDLSNYSTKTSRGATRKRWKPGTLLQEYNRLGGNKKGNKLAKGKAKRGPGVPFVMDTRGGKMVVRRKNRSRDSLEFLYSLNKKAIIDRKWEFEATVLNVVRNRYRHIIPKHLSNLR